MHRGHRLRQLALVTAGCPLITAGCPLITAGWPWLWPAGLGYGDRARCWPWVRCRLECRWNTRDDGRTLPPSVKGSGQATPDCVHGTHRIVLLRRNGVTSTAEKKTPTARGASAAVRSHCCCLPACFFCKLRRRFAMRTAYLTRAAHKAAASSSRRLQTFPVWVHPAQRGGKRRPQTRTLAAVSLVRGKRRTPESDGRSGGSGGSGGSGHSASGTAKQSKASDGRCTPAAASAPAVAPAPTLITAQAVAPAPALITASAVAPAPAVSTAPAPSTEHAAPARDLDSLYGDLRELQAVLNEMLARAADDCARRAAARRQARAQVCAGTVQVCAGTAHAADIRAAVMEENCGADENRTAVVEMCGGVVEQRSGASEEGSGILQARLGALEERFRAWEKHQQAFFGTLEERFKALEQHSGTLEERIGVLEARHDGVRQRPEDPDRAACAVRALSREGDRERQNERDMEEQEEEEQEQEQEQEQEDEGAVQSRPVQEGQFVVFVDTGGSGAPRGTVRIVATRDTTVGSVLAHFAHTSWQQEEHAALEIGRSRRAAPETATFGSLGIGSGATVRLVAR